MSKRHVVWDLNFRAWRDRRTGHYWVYHHLTKMWLQYPRDEIAFMRNANKFTYKTQMWYPGIGVFP